MAVEKKRKREKREREKVNDYSGTIVSERRRWRTHTLGPKSKSRTWPGLLVFERQLPTLNPISK
jgi:hypothetical protein